MITHLLLQAKSSFNWTELLLGSEDWSFLLETVFRTVIMFVIILSSLTLLGKRGVKQLSVFELVVIIGLGSAAGDPMFYKDVGILPALIVFGMIISLYTFVTFLVGKYKYFEKLLEGKPICLIKEGVFAIDNFKKEALAQDEFFAELRINGISQLGQIEEAIEEVSGEISIFYFADEKVKTGLPIMPNSLNAMQVKIVEPNFYACIFCGNTENIKPTSEHICNVCKKNEWIVASDRKRIV